MSRLSARSRLSLAGAALIASGLAMLWLAAGAVGAFDAIGAFASRWPPVPLSPVERGGQIYQVSCSGCHGGADAAEAAGYPPRHSASGRTWQQGDCEIGEVIRSGREPSAPGLGALAMPAFRDRLSDEEIADVIAFIKTMWTPDQRAAQDRLTRERCG